MDKMEDKFEIVNHENELEDLKRKREEEKKTDSSTLSTVVEIIGLAVPASTR